MQTSNEVAACSGTSGTSLVPFFKKLEIFLYSLKYDFSFFFDN